MPARLLAAAAMLLLTACATGPQQVPGSSQAELLDRYESRTASIKTLERWSLDGKLAVSDGKEGGSGRLQWTTESGRSELDFRGTLGRGAWQLDIDPDLATLTLANGETWQAADVSSLVRDHVGWDVPVESLSWWVRGVAAPGRVDHQSFDDNGRMTLLSQHGWDVEYERYKEFSGMALPTRLDARNGERHVKFVMRGWTIPDRTENDS